MTVRKQVEEGVRIALAKRISSLLDERTSDGKKVMTQSALGKLLGVSQEAARRARDPDGVTPAIVDGMAKKLNYVVFGENGPIPDPEELSREASAIELLVRRGVALREAERAVLAARIFKHDEPLLPEQWADLAQSLVIANEKNKMAGKAPQPPHPKKPPKVGR